MRSPLHPFIAACLALFALPCLAITKAPPALKHVGGNVWEAVHDAGNTVSSTRTWAKGTEVGSAKATDVFTWVFRERSKIPITATTTVGASVVGRIAAKALPIVGTASLVYDVWTELGCKFEDGQIKCDQGNDAGQVPGTLWQPGDIGACARSSLFDAMKCSLPAGFGITDFVVLSQTSTSARVRYTLVYPDGNTIPGNEFDLRPVPALVTGCPSNVKLLPSGKCPSGTYDPMGEDGAADHWGQHAPKVPGYADKVPGIVDEAVGSGVPVPSSPPAVSGPPSVSSPGPSVTTTAPNGATTTTNTTNTINLTYNGSQIIINESSTTTNPDGSTTTTTDESFMDWLCGISGMPDCNVKVNEAGTPKWEQPSNKALDDIKAADAIKLNEVAQTIPQPDLGWFGAPPIAACRKIVYPHGIGEADPCGVVDSVRSVMAYLWAIVAAWMSFGWIRQAVNGG